MNKSIFYLFVINLFLFHGIATGFLKEQWVTMNLTNHKSQVTNNYSDNVLKIVDTAHILKALLTEEELIQLIKLILPIGFHLEIDGCSDDEQKTNSPVSKYVFKDMMAQNVTNIPTYELLHVPELLANATNLRQIRNVLLSPRPIRPRRKFRARNPSNVPGVSSYIINENTVKGKGITHEEN